MSVLNADVPGRMQLSAEDLAERIPSGSRTKAQDRLQWAVVYLAKAGLLKRPKRGVLEITERGVKALAESHERIDIAYLNRFPEFQEFQRKVPAPSAVPNPKPAAESVLTPAEQLASAYEEIRQTLAGDILEAVKRSSPAFFEKLVVDLLVAMGYGGSLEDAGSILGRSGDEGIDGMIKEDKLGLDVIYIQAKRYSEGTVGRPQVQSFAGSLDGQRARKGVMLTTSKFSQDAKDYVARIEKKIVLIDGLQLAELMIDYNVGVSVDKTYVVKKLDGDFFDNE